MDINDLFKTADFKTEKHIPYIEFTGGKKGEKMNAEVSVGKEIPHPNTSEHFIAWIELYLLAEGDKFPIQIGRSDFVAHGASVAGPNMSSIYSEPVAKFKFKTEKAGTLIAISYCNIHGLWRSELKFELS